jgi:hypothetical protein
MRFAVDGAGRRDDKTVRPGFGEPVEQGEHAAGVGLPVAQRVGAGLADLGQSGEVADAVEGPVRQGRGVADVAEVAGDTGGECGALRPHLCGLIAADAVFLQGRVEQVLEFGDFAVELDGECSRKAAPSRPGQTRAQRIHRDAAVYSGHTVRWRGEPMTTSTTPTAARSSTFPLWAVRTTAVFTAAVQWRAIRCPVWPAVARRRRQVPCAAQHSPRGRMAGRTNREPLCDDDEPRARRPGCEKRCNMVRTAVRDEIRTFHSIADIAEMTEEPGGWLGRCWVVLDLPPTTQEAAHGRADDQ